MNKHELADQFIREIYQEFPQIRHGQNTAPALALLRACEKIRELENKLARSPATIAQDRAERTKAQGDREVPDTLVSPQDAPVLRALPVAMSDADLGQIKCPTCEYPIEPRYKDDGIAPVIIHYCGRCGYLEHR